MSWDILWVESEFVNVKSNKGLSIEELVKVATNIVITNEDVVQLKQRLTRAEERFEEEDKARRPDKEWHERRYVC